MSSTNAASDGNENVEWFAVILNQPVVTALDAVFYT